MKRPALPMPLLPQARLRPRLSDVGCMVFLPIALKAIAFGLARDLSVSRQFTSGDWLWQGRVLTWSIDGPTGWLDGKLQLNHKRFDGFRGALVCLGVLSCWDQTLVAACSDGSISCLDLLTGSRCAEFNVHALSQIDIGSGSLQYQGSILQAHSCMLNHAKNCLLWIQGGSLGQLDVEGDLYGGYKLRTSAARLLAHPDDVHVAIGCDDGTLAIHTLPLSQQ